MFSQTCTVTLAPGSGRATGVVLENGEELSATVIVTSLHPKTAFLDHVGRSNLPADFADDIERWKTRSGVVKINLALAELPDFTANPGTSVHRRKSARTRARTRARARRG